jgi:hypothetical protein
MFVSKTFAKQHNLKSKFSVKVLGGRNRNRIIQLVDKDDQYDVDGIDVFGQRLRIPDGKLRLICKKYDPDIMEREVHNIGGAAGIGKSYRAGDIATSYHKANPDNGIILISPLNDTPSLKKLKPTIINVVNPEMVHYNFYDDETKIKFIEDPSVDFEDQVCPFANSLIIFDDIEGCPDPGLEKKIHSELIRQCLTVGRHFNVSVIICKHQFLDWQRTRITIQEQHFFHFSPQDTNKQIRDLLETYVGLDKKTINSIFELPSRFVAIYTKFPKCVITDDELIVL